MVKDFVWPSLRKALLLFFQCISVLLCVCLCLYLSCSVSLCLALYFFVFVSSCLALYFFVWVSLILQELKLNFQEMKNAGRARICQDSGDFIL